MSRLIGFCVPIYVCVPLHLCVSVFVCVCMLLCESLGGFVYMSMGLWICISVHTYEWMCGLCNVYICVCLCASGSGYYI